MGIKGYILAAAVAILLTCGVALALTGGGSSGSSGTVATLTYATVYSAAGSPLPTASTSTHARACVSDASVCSNGTSYVSGGSAACEVWSNGTNWIGSGIGC